MDTKSIRFFMQCYRTRSFNRAAEELYISPQGLGKAMEKLEDELGTRLFERTRQGLLPTKSGEYFYEHCTELMDRLRDIEMEMKRIDEHQSRIRVGYACGAMSVLDFGRMQEFRLLDGLEFEERMEDFNEEIVRRVLHRELDLGVIIGESVDTRLAMNEIARRQPHAIVPRSHRFYDKKELYIRDLEGEPLITLSERYYLYHTLLQRCEEAGFVPNIVTSTMDSSLIHQLASEGRGIGIDVNIHSLEGAHVRAVPIVDAIPWSVHTVILRNSSDARTIDLAQQYSRFVRT